MGAVDTHLNEISTRGTLSDVCNAAGSVPALASMVSTIQGRGQLVTTNSLTDARAEVNGTYTLSSFSAASVLAGTETAVSSTISSRGKGTMNFQVKVNGADAYNYSKTLSADETRTTNLVVIKTTDVLARPDVWIYQSGTIDNVLMFINDEDTISSIESSVQGKIDSSSINESIAAATQEVAVAAFGGSC